MVMTTGITITVGYKRPPVPNVTVADLRHDLVDYLYDGMLNNRLGELTLRSDPPFLFGSAFSGGLGRTKSMYRLAARVRDGGVLRGLESLLLEAERVKRHGFSAAELERAKTNLLRSVDRSYEERDKQESAADRQSTFGTVLTREQLEALSDDPDILRQQLENMAGPGAVIKVDSFEGAALPPKAMIRSIRISRDQFAAENHSAGGTSVEIITQPGVGPIRYNTAFRYRGGRLSGKSPFTPTRLA